MAGNDLLVGRARIDYSGIQADINAINKALSGIGGGKLTSWDTSIQKVIGDLNAMAKAAEKAAVALDKVAKGGGSAGGGKAGGGVTSDVSKAIQDLIQNYRQLIAVQNEALKAQRNGDNHLQGYFTGRSAEIDMASRKLVEFIEAEGKLGKVTAEQYQTVADVFNQTRLAVENFGNAQKKISDSQWAKSQKADVDRFTKAYRDLTAAVQGYDKARKQGDAAGQAYWKAQYEDAIMVINAEEKSLDLTKYSIDQQKQIIDVLEKKRAIQQQYGTELSQETNIVGSLSAQWDKVHRVVMTIAGISLAKVWRDALEYVKEFDRAVTDIAVITQQPLDSAREMSSIYRTMASDLGVTSTEIARAAATIYRQGITDPGVVNGVVSGATKFGAVTGMTTDQAIASMTAAMQNFKEESESTADTVERIGDTWSYMGDAVATNGEEIANAMSKASASIKTVGVEFQTASAWAAVMLARTQQSGEVIGTQLNSLATRYMKISSKGYREVTQDDNGEALSFNDVSKALLEADIQIYDSTTGKFREMESVMDELAGKWANLDDATKRYIATQMAGTRGMNYFLTLMENYSTATDLATQSVEGIMDTKYDIWLQGVGAAQNNLKNSAEELFAVLSANTVAGMYNTFAGIVDLFTAGTEALNGWNVKLPLIVAGVAGLAVTIAKAWTSITSIIGAIKGAGLIAGLATGGVHLTAILVALTAIATVIGTIISAFKKDPVDLDAINQQIDDATAKMADLQGVTDELNALQEKYGDAASEAAEFVELRKKIVEASPGLQAAYGTEGELIGTVSQALAVANAEYEKMYQNRQALAVLGHDEAVKEYKEAASKYTGEYGEGEIPDAFMGMFDAYKLMHPIQAFSDANTDADFARAMWGDGDWIAAYVVSLTDTIRNSYEDLSPVFIESALNMFKSIQNQAKNNTELRTAIDGIIDEAIGVAQGALVSHEGELGELAGKFQSAVLSGFDVETGSLLMGDSFMSDFINGMFAALDESALTAENFDTLYTWAEGIGKAYADIMKNGISSGAIGDLLTISNQMDSSRVYNEFFNDYLQGLLNEFLDMQNTAASAAMMTDNDQLFGQFRDFIEKGVQRNVVEAFNDAVENIHNTTPDWAKAFTPLTISSLIQQLIEAPDTDTQLEIIYSFAPSIKPVEEADTEELAEEAANSAEAIGTAIQERVQARINELKFEIELGYGTGFDDDTVNELFGGRLAVLQRISENANDWGMDEKGIKNAISDYTTAYEALQSLRQGEPIAKVQSNLASLGLLSVAKDAETATTALEETLSVLEEIYGADFMQQWLDKPDVEVQSLNDNMAITRQLYQDIADIAKELDDPKNNGEMSYDTYAKMVGRYSKYFEDEELTTENIIEKLMGLYSTYYNAVKEQGGQPLINWLFGDLQGVKAQAAVADDTLAGLEARFKALSELRSMYNDDNKFTGTESDWQRLAGSDALAYLGIKDVEDKSTAFTRIKEELEAVDAEGKKVAASQGMVWDAANQKATATQTQLERVADAQKEYIKITEDAAKLGEYDENGAFVQNAKVTADVLQAIIENNSALFEGMDKDSLTAEVVFNRLSQAGLDIANIWSGVAASMGLVFGQIPEDAKVAEETPESERYLNAKKQRDSMRSALSLYNGDTGTFDAGFWEAARTALGDFYVEGMNNDEMLRALQNKLATTNIFISDFESRMGIAAEQTDVASEAVETFADKMDAIIGKTSEAAVQAKSLGEAYNILASDGMLDEDTLLYLAEKFPQFAELFKSLGTGDVDGGALASLLSLLKDDAVIEGIQGIENAYEAIAMLADGEMSTDDYLAIIDMFAELEGKTPEEMMSYLNDYIDEQREMWLEDAEAMGFVIDRYDQLTKQTEMLTSPMSEEEKILQKLVKAQGSNSKAYQLTAKELATLQKSYPSLRKEIMDYASGVDDGTKLSAALAKELNKTNLKNFTKNVDTALDKVKDATAGTEDYQAAVEKLADSFDFSGYGGLGALDNLDFVKQNLADIQAAAAGSEEAFRRLQAAAFINITGTSTADFSAVQNGMAIVDAQAQQVGALLAQMGMGTIETIQTNAAMPTLVPNGDGSFHIEMQQAQGFVQVWKPSSNNPFAGRTGGGGKKKSSGGGGGKGGGGGGGGGGGSMSVSDATKSLIDNIEHQQDNFDNRRKLIDLKKEYHELRGEIQGEIAYTQMEADVIREQSTALQDNIKTLEAEIKKQEQAIAANSQSSQAYKQAELDLAELNKAHREYSEKLLENTNRLEKIKKELDEFNEKARQTVISVQELIRDTIEGREEHLRDMLDGTVEVEDMILEVIKARYERERDLAIETAKAKQNAIDEEIDAIDRLINERKKLLDSQKEEKEIADLQAKIKRISADPTRRKELLELQAQLAEKQEEKSWNQYEEDLNAQKEALEQERDNLDDYINDVEEYYEELFKHPDKLIAEMQEVIKMSDAEIVEWLKANVEEFDSYTAKKQEQTVAAWQESLNQMRGYTETYQDEIEEIMSWTNEEILEWLKQNNVDFANASKEQQESFLFEWKNTLDDWRNAYKAIVAEINSYDYKVPNVGTYSYGGGGGGGYGGGGGGYGGYSGATNSSSGSRVNMAPSTMHQVTQTYRMKATGSYAAPNGRVYTREVNSTSNVSAAAAGTDARNKLLKLLNDEVKNAYKSALSAAGLTSSQKTLYSKNIADPSRVIRNVQVQAYARGGLNTSTGLAWLDGTPQRPERVLSAYQTELFEDLLNTLHVIRVSGLSGLNAPEMAGGSAGGLTIETINVNVDNLDTDDDYETLADRIGEVMNRRLRQTMSIGGVNFI